MNWACATIRNFESKNQRPAQAGRQLEGETMNKLPAIAGALAGSLAALACVAIITGAVTWAELIGGAVALAAIVAGLIIISEG